MLIALDSVDINGGTAKASGGRFIKLPSFSHFGGDRMDLHFPKRDHHHHYSKNDRITIMPNSTQFKQDLILIGIVHDIAILPHMNNGEQKTERLHSIHAIAQRWNGTL
jgi:hypothetical protein